MTRRDFAFLAVFLGLVIALPLFVLVPSSRAIRETSASILGEYQILEERHHQGLQVRRIREDYDKLSSSLTKLDNLAVKAGEELAFITTIEQLAKQNNVQEKLLLDFDAKQAKSGTPTIPLTITATGSYHNTIRFLHTVQAIPAVVAIRSLQIQPAAKASDTVVVLTLSGYFYER